MEANLLYAKRSYWDERFKNESDFEWLCHFDAFRDIMVQNLRTEHRIVHIGCGSSQLSMRLHDLGFTNIVNVDYSQVLVDSCRERYAQKFPEMKWVCDDIRSLERLPPNSADVVIEKATIEALLVAEKSPWNPSDSALVMLDQVFNAVDRVLCDNGIFVSISFTQPHFRVPALLRRPNWGVEVQEFGDTFHYYAYLVHKNKPTVEEVRTRYGAIAPEWSRSVDS